MKRILILLSIFIVYGAIQIPLYNPPTPENYVDLYQGKLAYIKYSSANSDKTLILIHGSPGSKEEDFEKLAPQIKDYNVYALDMYGFGDSDNFVNDYSAEAQSKAIAEFMNSKGIQRASILGYSWGGLVAIKFALNYPEKTENLILLDASGIQEGEPTHNYLIEKTRSLIAYPFVVIYPGAFAGSIGWRYGFIRSFIDTDQRPIREELTKIKSRTLILHGDKDTVVLPEVAQEHNLLLQNSELLFFKGGHGTIFFDPSEIANKINYFLNN